MDDYFHPQQRKTVEQHGQIYLLVIDWFDQVVRSINRLSIFNLKSAWNG